MDIHTSVSKQRISETELLSIITNAAIQHEFPFALWRLPSQQTKHLLVARHNNKLKQDEALEDQHPGFIFAPFDRNTDRIFLPADFMFTFENGSLKEPTTTAESNGAAWLKNILKQGTSVSHKPREENGTQRVVDNTESDYISLVERCIQEIEKGSVEKIVPSRSKRIDLPGSFDEIRSFEKLCSRYSHALVSLVNIPGIGFWMGATPEILVSVENKRIFKTVALAGTQVFREGTNLKTVAWTQKEIEEQALVERYVISCFKKIRVREYEEQGPKTIVAGNLIHLRSDFTVDMHAINFPQLGSVMLELLHPTSAVCGMPLEPALKFLERHEDYNRSFYSGYLGPVNVNNDIHIFVNLRCMQIIGQHAILYAGAGVTADSIPEEELKETEMKFNTLLNVISE